ncbi:MAG TPA: PxKF domain-containing protein [Pyrinomonadaceae bacterium]|nr:PxKF domain-containing protein [Pyrinomonadaceae bacterium]
MVIAGAFALTAGSSAATGRQRAAAQESAARAPQAMSTAPAALRLEAVSALPNRGVAPLAYAPWTPLNGFFQVIAPPLATYADDCSTTKTSFSLGDTICVKVNGAPTSITPLRRVVLANPAGFVVSSLDVTTSSQTFTFDLPSTSTSGDVDNRGNWVVGLIDTADVEVRRAVILDVHDPQQAVADLTISKIGLDEEDVVADTDVTYQIYVWNRGPDSATNARFADNTLPNTTFVSLTQVSGPTFNCTSPAVGTAGTSNCTAAAAFARGASAVFNATYHVNAAVSNGAPLDDTATVTSDTYDSAPSSDSYETTSSASNPSPPSCTIGCPANVTQDNDPGQAGAIVTYPDPTTGGSCGAVSTDHPSGSFFPIGTTVVNVTVAGGPSCSFSVTVNDTRTARITLNGPADQTVECTTGFTDLGANATDKDGNPLQVTTAVTVPDPSGAVDGNGDAIQVPAPGNVVNPSVPNNYTITYSATAPPPDSTTVTVKRSVHVVDTTPPVITLSNTAGYVPHTETTTVTNEDGTTSTITETILVGTIECHGSIGVPTATAFDGCDNAAVPVTTSGSINPDVPGFYEVTFMASDASGRVSQQRVQVTVVDTQKPVITLNGPASMQVLRTSTFTDPGATATDACAGPVPVTVTGTVDTSTAGVYTLTYNAVDPSGHAADPVTRTVTVYIYNFTGFFSPVGNPPTLNQVNAGRSVPVKFSLNGNQGLNIMAAGSPYSQQVTCGSSTPTDLQETGTAGSSSLTYDASSGQYIYVWKTESSWAGTCRVLTVALNDGSTYTANFKFK